MPGEQNKGCSMAIRSLGHLTEDSAVSQQSDRPARAGFTVCHISLREV